MFATKFLVPAFAVLGLASAQSSTSLCASATVTISSVADATALASSCSTVQGSVVIDPSFSGVVDLDGIEQIKGDLSADGAANVTALQASQLNSIGGTFNLVGLVIMGTLQMNSLTSVGQINWKTLAALQFLGFESEIKKAESLIISDTQLNNLDGINLDTVSVLDINNNPYLKNFSTQIANVTGSFNMDSNAANLDLQLPNLIFAYNMTLRNISTISIPSLQSINTTLGFYGDHVESIIAPNLTSIGGDLAIVANSALTNVSMPLLKTVAHSFQIANNSQLLNITGFPSLKTTGAVSLSGNYSQLELPALATVSGAFYAVSSGDFDCTPFHGDKFNQPPVIQGLFTCSPTSPDVQPSASSGSSTGTSTASSPSSTSTTKSGATNVYVNSGLLLVGGLAGLVSLAL
ncbi:MAG: hypothetical protein M1818_008358 [Claussenomyces sp. TS43310]|nr:MAG: hypothetical protein M1818_008358 [Claussenomyces sp. TS43310]